MKLEQPGVMAYIRLLKQVEYYESQCKSLRKQRSYLVAERTRMVNRLGEQIGVARTWENQWHRAFALTKSVNARIAELEQTIASLHEISNQQAAEQAEEREPDYRCMSAFCGALAEWSMVGANNRLHFLCDKHYIDNVDYYNKYYGAITRINAAGNGGEQG